MKRDYNEEKRRRAKSSNEESLSEKRAKEKKEIREGKKTFSICFRQRKR
jgi:hypothetical protein